MKELKVNTKVTELGVLNAAIPFGETLQENLDLLGEKAINEYVRRALRLAAQQAMRTAVSKVLAADEVKEITDLDDGAKADVINRAEDYFSGNWDGSDVSEARARKSDAEKILDLLQNLPKDSPERAEALEILRSQLQ